MISIESRKAIEFSALKLKHVVRKRTGLPYYTHIVRVICFLLEHGVRDNSILSAGALHDNIEEGNCSAEELSNHFKEPTVKLVVELTDSSIDDSLVLKQHKIFLAKYVYSNDAIIISCSDKYDNFYENISEYKLGLTKFTPSKIDYYFGLYKSFEYRLQKKHDRALENMLKDYRLLLAKYENEVK